MDEIQSGVYWSEGNTAWEYREHTSVFLGQEIEHWIEFGSVHHFGQRKPENENIPRKKFSDPQTDCCSLYLP
jgi:hypothetical protein